MSARRGAGMRGAIGARQFRRQHQHRPYAPHDPDAGRPGRGAGRRHLSSSTPIPQPRTAEMPGQGGGDVPGDARRPPAAPVGRSRRLPPASASGCSWSTTTTSSSTCSPIISGRSAPGRDDACRGSRAGRTQGQGPARISSCCRRGRADRTILPWPRPSMLVVRLRLPIFGVCLGVQAIVEYFGGALDLLASRRHGKAVARPGDGRPAVARPAGRIRDRPLSFAVRASRQHADVLVGHRGAPRTA